MPLILKSKVLSFKYSRVIKKIIEHKVTRETRELKRVNQELEESNLILHKKNKEILDSIQYAQLIHQAILPKKRHFDRAFTESFLIYQPKDIIGGDFYWVAQQGEKSFIAMADCTGHGVPGALLSVLGHSLLNYIVLGKSIYNPKEIIKELDLRVIDSFHMAKDEVFNNDWMDISICCYNNETGELEFSGAKQSLYLVRDGEVKEYAGDKFPVAGWQVEKNRNFSLQKITLQKNDVIYFFSDGFMDQFGGPGGKKYTKKRMKSLLLTVAGKRMEMQKKNIEKEFKTWKGKLEQVDDVCIVGIKV